MIKIGHTVMFDSSIDYSKIHFSAPVVQGDRYFIQAQHETESIMTQFNRWMCAKNDLVDDAGTMSTQLDVLIAGTDTEVSPFIEFVSDFEDAMLRAAKEHKSEWFPSKDISDDWLDGAFHSGFKQVKKSNDAVMRLRVSKDMHVYTSEREEATHADVKDGSTIALIVHMEGLWFTKSRFGLTWKVVQAKIKKEKAPSRRYMFDDATPEPLLDNVFPEEVM